MRRDFFVPGRTELAGNHTDHQNGRILASAVDLGLYATAAANGSKLIRIQSEGFPPFRWTFDSSLSALPSLVSLRRW